MDWEDNIETKQAWFVPNQEAYGSLSGVMLGINNIFTFPCKNLTRTGIQTIPNTPNETSAEPIKMCLVKKNSWLFGRYQRKLINEALDTFLSIQRSVANAEKDISPLLIRKSKEYRSMIQACVSEMTRYVEDVESNKSVPIKEDPQDLKVSCQLLYKMELILGLVEIVFVDMQPGNVVLNHLMNWIRLHFPQCRQRLAEALSSDQPVAYPNYWETCYGLVLQGFLDEARDLLSRHPDSNFDSFLSMNELLRKMPSYMAYSGISESEFSVRWNHWQRECETRLRNGEFAQCKQLEIICKILLGDIETYTSLTEVLDTWYHFMASHLLYSNPTCKVHRLAAAAQDAIEAFGGESQATHLDHLLLSIMQINDHLVLKQCQSVLDNLWFTSHLADLLFHALGKHPDKKYLKDIRECFLVDYGSELVSHHSLWQIGLVYLDASGPTTSIPSVQAVLERIPLTSDDKAKRVIQAATERGFDDVAMGVCRVMGRRMLREGHLGAAIWWGVRSQDAAFTSHLAHKILHKYMEDGQFRSSSLLDHLGPSMLLSDTLTFLSKYREFHTLYQEGDIKAAASLLVSLIASRLAPEYFWPVLLEDSLPLLESPEPVITADQTYKLMYCLHNIAISCQDSDLIKTKKQKLYASFFDKENDVRLALTNNLARAIIQEGTTMD